MRILHVSMGLPPFRTGGLNQYCLDLMTEQKRQGEEVALLFPGNYSFGKTRIKRENHFDFNLFKIINPLPLALNCGINAPERYYRKCNSDCYEQFLKHYKFDVIHIHCIMGIHLEFFQEAKKQKIKMIMTTHDYYPFCITCNLVYKDGNLCGGPSAEKCFECNKGRGLSEKQEHIMQSQIYKVFKTKPLIKKIRKKAKKQIVSSNKDVSNKTVLNFPKVIFKYKKLIEYNQKIVNLVDCIHCNSDVAKEIYSKYLKEIDYKVIPITKSGLSNTLHTKKIEGKVLKIGFIGTTNPVKGLNVLIESLFEILDKEHEIIWELELYGDDYSDYEKLDQRIKNRGCFVQDQLGQVFSNIDLLIVPSIWYETFGFVVLEAMAYGVPVIVSDLVGAKILLKESSIFRHDDIVDLANKIINPQNTTGYERMSLESISLHTLKIRNLYR